jgi:hypothetical protein
MRPNDYEKLTCELRKAAKSSTTQLGFKQKQSGNQLASIENSANKDKNHKEKKSRRRSRSGSHNDRGDRHRRKSKQKSDRDRKRRKRKRSRSSSRSSRSTSSSRTSSSRSRSKSSEDDRRKKKLDESKQKFAPPPSLIEQDNKVTTNATDSDENAKSTSKPALGLANFILHLI